MSHSLATLTASTILRLPEHEMQVLISEHPNLMKAFSLDMLVAAEVQREWTVSLGRRSAVERMAHLLYEVLLRLRAVGLANAGGCEMPITQADLGEALGLSSVHVNRTLQELRDSNFIELRGKRFVARDETALQALALFNPNYLHLQQIDDRAAFKGVVRH